MTSQGTEAREWSHEKGLFGVIAKALFTIKTDATVPNILEITACIISTRPNMVSISDVWFSVQQRLKVLAPSTHYISKFQSDSTFLTLASRLELTETVFSMDKPPNRSGTRAILRPK